MIQNLKSEIGNLKRQIGNQENSMQNQELLSGYEAYYPHEHMERYGVPVRFKDFHLGCFDPRIIKALGDLNAGIGYFIHGPTGTGKTALACAILKQWVRTGRAIMKTRGYGEITHSEISVRFTLSSIMLGQVDEKARRGEMYYPVEEYGKKVKAMVIDDIGCEKATESRLGWLCDILSLRYDNLLPTVFTSNLDLEEFNRIDPRIASRLGGYREIVLEGEDRRIQEVMK